MSSLPTLSPINSPLLYNNTNTTISQHNLHQIIRQQQKQLVAMQIQIQALMAGGVVERTERVKEESNIGSNIKMAKPPMFNRDTSRIGGFITACRLYLRMKMKGVTVKEKIQ